MEKSKGIIMKRTQQMLATIGLAALALALLLSGCDVATTVREINSGEATRIANAPIATAAAIANNAEATRVAVVAGEKARLELERDQKLQEMTLLQQANQQVEEHARQMAIISSTYAYSFALIQSESMSH